MSLTAIELSVFASRVETLCAEMGAVLQQAAFSPNIKDRLDYSCALFDSRGELFAQAAHIPVHLGSMAFAMADLVEGRDWQPGDMLVVNDPFMGGTHLPDVTLIAPFFWEDELLAFVANRAHHANIGADTPGSMPVSSTLEEEGVVIAPALLFAAGREVPATRALLDSIEGQETAGDFAAQISANNTGLNRLQQLLQEQGKERFLAGVQGLNEYAERIVQRFLQDMPHGEWHFTDQMDDDGFGQRGIQLTLSLTIGPEQIIADFTGTSAQVQGNINCPLSVAAAAVFYVFRCLLPAYTPACAGAFSLIRLIAPEGTLLNARRPAATAAGNVETSMRIVDLVLGALAQAVPERIPAASQGTMNNVAMGARGEAGHWDYYETIGGGLGASHCGPGLSCVQAHMTNTLNTPAESLEQHYPLRVVAYQRRQGSGGAGRYEGGDGLIREFEFLAPAEVTLLTERRDIAPWGLAGGEAGRVGKNLLDGVEMPSKTHIKVTTGQRLRIETPGGGGYGKKNFQEF
ncbi:MAG: hydantoinase B/oxoprolinase family protein [Pseudomonadales bacterium]|nr:hydantoinase B/oxoprolinase family protein [Pseudomonadales bacterium]